MERRHVRIGGVLLALIAGGCRFNPDTRASSEGSSVDAALPVTDDGGNNQQPACMTDPDYAARTGSDHRYHHQTTTANYDDAQAACAASGAHLVVIGDADENEFVIGLGGEPWIGYDDLEIEGSFSWVNGEPAAFEDWGGSDEPNDNGGREDCALIRGTNWNDDRCGKLEEYVCECDPGYVAPSVPTCMTSAAYSDISEGRRYRFEANRLDYAQAQASCAAEGAHLVVITDLNENVFAASLVSEYAWIGYDDRESEGTFGWITGSANPYEHWKSNQPDSDGNEDCVELYQDDEWNDRPCETDRQFVCECDPQR